RLRDGHLITRGGHRAQQNEASVIGSWIRRHGDQARLVSVSGTWAIPITAAPSARFVTIKR
ncbi:MAG TPA: hypothetical protein VE174_00005, partial [Actinomycetota bacterium]|nr:hypothetical protein [Actinomycetota bacterium]